MKRKRLGCFGTFLIILLVFIVIAVIILIDSNTRLVTTEYKLTYSNLPPAFDGFRIVLLADLHGNEHGENNKKLVEQIKKAKPDIIAIAGDLVDRYQPGHNEMNQLKVIYALIPQLTEIAPVYYVTGNHEWDSGVIRNLLDFLNEQTGVYVLRNEYKRLTKGSDSIILAGIDDPGGPADMIKPRDFIGKVVSSEAPDFLAVMVHRNYNLRLLSELDVDLVLSGHAHGGMVRLPFTDGFIGPSMEFFPTYTSGVYTQSNTNMVVTRGLGNHLGWTRFLNNPQVVVVELNR